MSQRGLASRMQTLGHPVDPSAITRIEKLGRRMSVSEFLVIAAALDVSPADLLTPTDGKVEVGHVALTPEDASRWFAGDDPRIVLRSLIRYEAEGFARVARPGDSEWVGKLAETVLGDDDLLATFEGATRETPRRRAFLMHMVMSTAAYGRDFSREGWDRIEEGETE